MPLAGLPPAPLPSLEVASAHAAAAAPVWWSSLVEHSPGAVAAQQVLTAYTSSLAHHPLVTKMATGGLLATAGDAIAQSQSQPEKDYDTRRALSFMVFDMSYRALQHVVFPIIVQACQGQYLGSLLGSSSFVSTDYAAALEQTLASQLGIVPFLYYPVFFTLTAAIQGLSARQGWERAVTTFGPLMQRNLLFWIPVQFVQFGFVPEPLQIPFLSVAGLCWTFILSVAAGSATQYQSSQGSSSSGNGNNIHESKSGTIPMPPS